MRLARNRRTSPVRWNRGNGRDSVIGLPPPLGYGVVCGGNRARLLQGKTEWAGLDDVGGSDAFDHRAADRDGHRPIRRIETVFQPTKHPGIAANRRCRSGQSAREQSGHLGHRPEELEPGVPSAE